MIFKDLFGIVTNQCHSNRQAIWDIIHFAYLIILQFVDAFKKFNDVVRACFSDSLDSDYAIKISQFQRVYRNLGISETLKAHVLFDDVPRFLATRDHGLGRYSEQAIEAIYAVENNRWKNYAVDLRNKNYGAQMLKSTLDINGMNIK